MKKLENWTARLGWVCSPEDVSHLEELEEWEDVNELLTYQTVGEFSGFYVD